MLNKIAALSDYILSTIAVVLVNVFYIASVHIHTQGPDGPSVSPEAKLYPASTICPAVDLE